MRFLERIRSLPLLARMGTASHSNAHIVGFYELFWELYEAACAPGMRNFGYSLSPESADLHTAQREMVRLVTRNLRGRRWLDVGSGEGGPAVLNALERGVQVTGINISDAQNGRAMRLAAEHGLSAQVRFLNSDAQSMNGVLSRSFDGVYALESALHYPDKPAFIREAMRVITPGGRFVVADLERSTDMDAVSRRLLEVGEQFYAVPDLPPEGFWEAELEAAGFVDIRVLDITMQTLPLGVEWAQSIRRSKVGGLPLGLVRGAAFLLHRLGMYAERAPVRYVMVSGVAPSDLPAPELSATQIAETLMSDSAVLRERMTVDEVALELQRLVPNGAPLQEFEAGQIIFAAGEVLDAAFVVISGSVDEWGQKIRLGIRRPGQLVGEIAVLASGHRESTQAVAREHTLLIRVEGQDIRDVVASGSPLASALMDGLARHATEWASRAEKSVNSVLKQYFPGGRAMVMPGPYRGTNVELFMFIFEPPADRFDPLLPPGVEWHPLMPWCFVAMGRYPDFRHRYADRQVRMQYMETAVEVPVLVRKASGEVESRVMFPFLFPDSIMALFAGREIYGLPKMEASTYIDDDIGRAALRSGGRNVLEVGYRKLDWAEVTVPERVEMMRRIFGAYQTDDIGSKTGEEPDLRDRADHVVTGIRGFLDGDKGNDDQAWEQVVSGITGGDGTSVAFAALARMLEAVDSANFLRLFGALPPVLRTVKSAGWKRVFHPQAELLNEGPVPWDPNDFQVDGLAGCQFEMKALKEVDFLRVDPARLQTDPDFVFHGFKLASDLGIRIVLDMDMLPDEMLIDYRVDPPTTEKDRAELAWGPAVTQYWDEVQAGSISVSDDEEG